MKELLDDLLELSSLVSHQRPVRPNECSPAIILHDIQTVFTPVAEAKGLKLIAWLDPALERLQTDAGMIKQIVTNLVSNAIKYTEAGEICLEFRLAGSERWKIVVKDTGVGIAADEHDQIFVDLYRVEKTAHLQGIGLGLSIVSRLVELLNGAVNVESEPGRGSRFEVVLPCVHISASKEEDKTGLSFIDRATFCPLQKHRNSWKLRRKKPGHCRSGCWS